MKKWPEADPLNRTLRDPVVYGCLTFAVATGVIGLVMAMPAVQTARRLARDSAHGALWNEIGQQLRAREVTGDFPAGLEELPLTYPDNGTPELLKLIDYRREGAGCRVSTILRGQKLEKQYGQPEG